LFTFAMQMLNSNVISMLSIVKAGRLFTLIISLTLVLSNGCENKSKMSLHKNNLKYSLSPYLQQHANNPVHWQAWNEDVLSEAQELDKLLIVSIGYSSCHWCHVMEHECFEDEEAAALMNEHFVSIKVDREERPDIDEVYMTALQLMTKSGGWPLNVVCLPNGKPIWGATYVPKSRWIQVLGELNNMYRNNKEEVLEYANKLTKGIEQSQLITLNTTLSPFMESETDSVFENWRPNLDMEEGGANRAPKFPMPVNLDFMLHYGVISGNTEALDYLELTLDKMSQGGIYDQIGGGFARYSTDTEWKVPHFEKMLYDNAQLISLYAKAYRHFQKPDYKAVLLESIAWVERELKAENGPCYSALDADSEGEEGKFYVWTLNELETLIAPEEWASFYDYYQLEKEALWEHGNYILLRRENDSSFCDDHSMVQSQLDGLKENWKITLLKARAARVRPGLDDKALTSWNALMIEAYIQSYRALGKDEHLATAKQLASWILDKQSLNKQQLWHAWYDGTSHIEGLIEDYAFASRAFILLYQETGNSDYLQQAERWVTYAQSEFEEKKSGLFYTRPKDGEKLIARSQETADNVIASANSTMAHNLFMLGEIKQKSAYKEQALVMLNHLKSRTMEYGESYANWAKLLIFETYPYYEVVITGDNAQNQYQKLNETFLPQSIILWSETEQADPLFVNRYVKGETLIYVCSDGACQLPQKEVSVALDQIL
jgi:uncharacterized protein YyaL (SSP411 family)